MGLFVFLSQEFSLFSVKLRYLETETWFPRSRILFSISNGAQVSRKRDLHTVLKIELWWRSSGMSSKRPLCSFRVEFPSLASGDVQIPRKTLLWDFCVLSSTSIETSMSRRRDLFGVLELKVKLQFWRKPEISRIGEKTWRLWAFLGQGWVCPKFDLRLERAVSVLSLWHTLFAVSDTSMKDASKFAEEEMWKWDSWYQNQVP